MGILKVDFLGGEAERQARHTTARLAVVFAVVVGVFAAIGAGASYRAASHGTTVFEEVGNLPVISDIRRLAWGESGDAGTPDDRLTFLLLGVGGEGHAGSNLTDTMLIVTADLKEQRIGIVSIPRDMAFPLGGGRFMKINAVHAYAEQAHPGEGAKETAKAIEDLLSIRIDHVVRVDFEGFESFIDALGGVDITVEQAFTDVEYPTEDDKWQTVKFEAGQQHMSGARALIYVRSRHGNNGEAGDFARSRRQQILMLAIKDRLLSHGVISNPQRVMKLYEAAAKNVQTDLSPWDLVKLAPLAQEFSPEKITTIVLTDGPQGELVPANVDGTFMLFPRQQDWSDIREIAADPFKTKEERLKEVRPTSPISIEVKNGTTVTGFAGQVADRLAAIGYQIGNVGNAAFRGYEHTVIYDLTNGAKSPELARLKQMLDANISTATISTSSSSRSIIGEGLTKESIAATGTDFLIILGESTRGIVDQIGTQ